MKKRVSEVQNRQSMFTMKVVIVMLCVFVVVYIGLNIFRSFQNPISTVNAVYASEEDVISLQGWFLRDEELLSEEDGIVKVAVEEGARVGVGQIVAEVYEDTGALEEQQTLEKLNSQIAQLEDAINTSSDIGSTQKLEENLITEILNLCDQVSEQNFSSLESQTEEIRSLIFKWDYAFEDAQEAKNSLEALKAERDQLAATASSSVHSVRISESGTYSSMVDGYEEELTVEMLDHITVTSLNHWEELQHDVEANQYIGKLVKGFCWYYVTTMDYESASEFREGDTVTLRLTGADIDTFTVEIDRIGENEDGTCVVVLRSDSYLSDTVALRRENADIILETYEGIKIPKEAVRMNENGQLGVYCLMGVQARFRKVEIIYEADDYYLSEYMPTDTSYVRAGDEVLISSREMYDGKIVE